MSTRFRPWIATSTEMRNRIKYFHGIATQYFKTASNFLTAFHLAGAMLWIKYYEPAT